MKRLKIREERLERELTGSCFRKIGIAIKKKSSKQLKSFSVTRAEQTGDTYSPGRPAPRWSRTGCTARCPESRGALCRPRNIINNNHSTERHTFGVTRKDLKSGRWGADLFVAVFCERWVGGAAASSSSSEPESRSFLERFLSFSKTCEKGAEISCTTLHSGSKRYRYIYIFFLIFCSWNSAWISANLFEVGKLDELHGHFRVLQLHSFAHAGLGMRRGQTDQCLQCSGRDGGGLERRGNNTGSKRLKKKKKAKPLHHDTYISTNVSPYYCEM